MGFSRAGLHCFFFVGLLLCGLMVSCGLIQRFYPAGSEHRFSFRFYDPVAMGPARLECFDRCLFEAVYSQQAPLVFESHNGITLYKGEEALQFKLVECGQPIAMRLPPGYAERVPVQPGRTYQVGAKLLPASPNTNGVMIHEDDQLIFQGVYDWYAGRTITFIESSPIQVYQHSTLTNHYSTESPCSNKVFHTRIASSMDDEEILLH